MPLQVIGAGFGRTGTSSLQAAFTQLGFGPTYHMTEVLKNGSAPHWRAAAAGTLDNWELIFAGYGATTDFPASTFYKELMEAYPDAKVVLTVRDFDSWYNSAENTIYKAKTSMYGVASLLMPTLRSAINETVWDRVFHGKFEDKEYTRKIYEDYITEVKQSVPAEKLLVFSVKEGWEPLCRFLDVPVPEGDFPRLNDKEEFNNRISTLKKVSFAINAVALVLPVSIAVGAYYYFKE